MEQGICSLLNRAAHECEMQHAVKLINVCDAVMYERNYNGELHELCNQWTAI